MELKEIYDQFMDSSEYGYHRVEAYIMTYPFYISLLNSNLKKNYADVFRCGHRRIKICMIAISGYPIFLSDKFSDKYAFSEVLIDQEFSDEHKTCSK